MHGMCSYIPTTGDILLQNLTAHMQDRLPRGKEFLLCSGSRLLCESNFKFSNLTDESVRLAVKGKRVQITHVKMSFLGGLCGTVGAPIPAETGLEPVSEEMVTAVLRAKEARFIEVGPSFSIMRVPVIASVRQNTSKKNISSCFRMHWSC